MSTDFTDIHDWVADLIQGGIHRQAYGKKVGNTTWTATHVIYVPSLLDQLASATVSCTGEAGAGVFASRPAAHLEALDTLAQIDLEASRWVKDLGEDDPATTKACISKLHGLHASAHSCGKKPKKRCCTKHTIEQDIRRWWTQARILTGWDSPAWRPDNTCPMCDKRGSLRVRLAAHSALCIDCRETWDASTIGLLADHIRLENAEDETPGILHACSG
jgi:hypothetical protein